MAGYSGTPLVKKIGLKEGHKAVFLNEPAGFRKDLGALPAKVKPAKELNGSADVVVAFHQERTGLSSALPKLRAAIEPDGMVWIAWPKKSSSVATDLTEDVVRQLALAAAMVDVKVCAIDETWSGLKRVIRLKDRK